MRRLGTLSCALVTILLWTSVAVRTQPVTPGTIALLVEHGSSPAILPRLIEGLKDTRAPVRAAAARVILVLGLRSLTPAILDALEAEADAETAAEMFRVAAQFGSAALDARLLGVLKRFDRTTGFTPHALAAVRGAAALDYLQHLPQDRDGDGYRGAFIRVALREDAARLSELGSRGLRDADARLFNAVLIAIEDSDSPVSEALLDAGLAETASEEIRLSVVQHLFRAWDGTQPNAERMRKALIEAHPRLTKASQPEGIVAAELVGRLAGNAPRTDPEWQKLLADPSREAGWLLGSPGGRALLTDGELVVVSRALGGDPKDLRRPTAGPPARSGSRPATNSGSPLMRTVSGYPPGYMTAVFSATGCNVDKAWKGDVGAAFAEITLRPDGRPRHVRPVGPQASPECMHASRILFMTYTADVGRVVADDQRDLAVVPFSSGLAACEDAPSGTVPPPTRLWQGRVDPPKKIKDVRPVYPPTAQADRVQGSVVLESIISPAGCITAARVIETVDPRLDWSALRAVIGWRFTPTHLNGHPVTVIMTVKIEFALK